MSYSTTPTSAPFSSFPPYPPGNMERTGICISPSDQRSFTAVSHVHILNDKFLSSTGTVEIYLRSVPDPDPYVFGPPGSVCHQAKIVRKTLIPTVL
jgi:hypothetical protein